MALIKKGTNIGRVIASRAKDYPVRIKEPTRKPKRRTSCWIVCPDFKVKAPKVVSEVGVKKDYRYTIYIMSETRKERDEALDYMIGCGQEEIEAGNKQFWLYAVDHTRKNKGLFLATLTYIFRVKQGSEQSYKEVK